MNRGGCRATRADLAARPAPDPTLVRRLFARLFAARTSTQDQRNNAVLEPPKRACRAALQEAQ